MNHQIIPGHVTDIDYQMNTLEQILYRKKDRILKAPTPLFEATEVFHLNLQIHILLTQKTEHICLR